MSILQSVERWFKAQPYLRELRARPELGFSILFDPAYYRGEYRGPLPPLLHFIVAGAFIGCDPHPLFDTAFYSRKYPDVAASGVNPLFHYLLHGAAEGRKPHPLFEPSYYVAQCPEAAAQPLLHFLKTGHDVQPHPLFDPWCYRRAHPATSRPGGNPLVDFVRRGPGEVTEGSHFQGGD